MSRRFLILLAVLLLMTMAIPVAAGGPAEKATGSGFWTSSGGLGDAYYGEFNAHEELNGRPAKGHLLQELVGGSGGFTVDVTDVIVGVGNEGQRYACFGGLVDAAWGSFDGRQGWYRWAFVEDGGEPGIGVDVYRSGWNVTPPRCINGRLGGNVLTGGNFQVHFAG